MPVPPVVPVEDNGWCVTTVGDIQPVVQTLHDGGAGAIWGPITGAIVNHDETTLYFTDDTTLYKMAITWGPHSATGFAFSVVASGLTTACKPGLSSDGLVYVCETSLNRVVQVDPATGSVVVACTLAAGPIACDIYDTLATGEGLIIVANDGSQYGYVGAPGGVATSGGATSGTDVAVHGNGWSLVGGIAVVDLTAFFVIGDAGYSTVPGHVGAVIVYSGRYYGELTGPASVMVDGDYSVATFVSVTDCAVSKVLPRHVFVVGDGDAHPGKAIRWLTVNPFDFLDPAPGGLVPGGKIYADRVIAVWSYDTAASGWPDTSLGLERVASFPSNENWFRDVHQIAVDLGGNSYLIYYQEGANPGDPVPPLTLVVAKVTPAGVVTDPWVTIPGVPAQHFYDNLETIGYGLDGNLYVVSQASGHQQVHKITLAGVITEMVPLRDPTNNYQISATPVAAPDGTLWLASNVDPDNAAPGVNSVLVKYDPSSGAVSHVPIQALTHPTSVSSDVFFGLTADTAGHVFAGMEDIWIDEVIGPSPHHIAGSWTVLGDPVDGCGVAGPPRPQVTVGRIRTLVGGGGSGSIIGNAFYLYLDDDGSTLWLLDSTNGPALNIISNLWRKLSR